MFDLSMFSGGTRPEHWNTSGTRADCAGTPARLAWVPSKNNDLGNCKHSRNTSGTRGTPTENARVPAKHGGVPSKISNLCSLEHVEHVEHQKKHNTEIAIPYIWDVSVMVGSGVSSMVVIDPAHETDEAFMRCMSDRFGAGRVLSANRRR